MCAFQSEYPGFSGGFPAIISWESKAGLLEPNPTIPCDGSGSWVQKADGNWCRCGSFYLIYNSLYRRDLTTNAGGRLLSLPGQSAENCTLTTNSDGSGTYECTSENLQHFLQLLGGADLIIDETFVLNHGAYSLDDFVRNFGLDGANAPSLKAREAGAVYRIDGSVSDARADGTVGTNWYEQMPVQPQVRGPKSHHCWEMSHG